MFNRFRYIKFHKRYKQIAKAKSYFPEFAPLVFEYFFTDFGYAMPLSLLAKIEKICKEIEPNLVIEFGSGLSTIVITDVLSGTEGFLISIDESMKWLAKSYQLVNHTSRGAFICLPYNSGINHAALSKYLLAKAKPDLVIIDGPSRAARFSVFAMEVYSELLSPNCVCVVDDTDREENDLGASTLAAKFSLHKKDYGDPIYVSHQYSILFPECFDEGIF